MYHVQRMIKHMDSLRTLNIQLFLVSSSIVVTRDADIACINLSWRWIKLSSESVFVEAGSATMKFDTGFIVLQTTWQIMFSLRHRPI